MLLNFITFESNKGCRKNNLISKADVSIYPYVSSSAFVASMCLSMSRVNVSVLLIRNSWMFKFHALIRK